MRPCGFFALILAAVPPLAWAQSETQPATSQPAGFRGIWYAHEPKGRDPEPAWRGGLATFSPQHAPMAIYAEAVRKTFFVYGGSSDPGKPGELVHLQICISSFDHATGRLARPVAVVDRISGDPRANPALSLDSRGHLWVFAPASHPGERGEIFKSRRVYDLTAFEPVAQFPFSYPQPWYIEGKGFVFVFTRLLPERRELCAATSADGSSWGEPRVLAAIQDGSDAVSWRHREKISVAFNYHPTGGEPGTDLYYVETPDAGRSWATIHHDLLKLPLKTPENPALVFDYALTKQSVWLKDLNFDMIGNPTILCLVSPGGLAGSSGPLLWVTARWVPRGWRIGGLIRSDNPCDSGSIYIENRSDWRILAPTSPGPEPDSPGGEVVSWYSEDFGRAWARSTVTSGSEFNQNDVRRPFDVRPEFYGFWADGAIRRASESHLYFSTRDGQVFRMPWTMTADTARPEPVSPPATEPIASKPQH